MATYFTVSLSQPVSEVSWRISVSISKATRHILKKSCDKKRPTFLCRSSPKEGVRHYSLPHSRYEESFCGSIQDWKINMTYSCISYFCFIIYSPPSLRLCTSESSVSVEKADSHVHQKSRKIYGESFLAEHNSGSSLMQVFFFRHVKAE